MGGRDKTGENEGVEGIRLDGLGGYYQTRRTGPMMVLGGGVIPSFFFGYFKSDMISINRHTMLVIEKRFRLRDGVGKLVTIICQ